MYLSVRNCFLRAEEKHGYHVYCEGNFKNKLPCKTTKMKEVFRIFPVTTGTMPIQTK